MADAWARAVLVAAAASGQGKTTVTAALARKLVRAGLKVRVFKTGPDFLDPMMLARACGAPVHTLDLWLVGAGQCRAQLARAARDADAILIEGVMGLYDGTPSSADLANASGIPVLAVIDASAMAQTAGALALGLRDYGPVELAGVVANRVGGAAHARMIGAALRGVPLVASLARQEASLPERHLGLLPPEEVGAIDALLDRLASELVLDMAAWNAIPATRFGAADDDDAAAAAPSLRGKTIAVARDDAFAFLYPANLDCLRDLGADLAFFSPLANQPVPAGTDAVYLPGGYPELHARALAEADRWRASIRAAHAAGVPIVAECGGMMALCEQLTDADAVAWPMAGLLPGRVVMQKRLAALGPQAWYAPQGELRGHAFHFSRFDTPLTPAAHALRHPDGSTGEAIYRCGALTASYFHAWFPSCPAAAAALFLGEAAQP
ncbi:MAG TPA: cobyrinate a,c-diamide synthase [Paucimonas sp.]|nr:cobyrinate a,c-diamide synthase [Paucimonas sp.]